VDAIRIPIDGPVTFDALRELNPERTAAELAEAFSHLPRQLQDEAWETLRLRIELERAPDGGTS
jgi:hypothetical protein